MYKDDCEIDMIVLSRQANKTLRIIATNNTENLYVIVEDNGQICRWDVLDLEPYNPRIKNPELEEEFHQIFSSVGEEIHQKTVAASELLREACKLADQNGIPFYSDATLIGQSYVPRSFADKWIELDPKFVSNLTEVLSEDLNIDPCGWETSENC